VTERSLRAAIVGYGLAGAVFHAPVVASVAGMEVAAIVVRDPARRARAARDFPAAALMERVEEVWERSGELDLVVVATPNRAHVAIAGAAIEAGLPVVVDKPLATTADAARGLVERAAARGVMLTVFQNRRFDGDFLTLRGLLASGALGRVRRFESRYERWRPEVGAGWRELAGPEEGGGVLLDLGTHLVDQALVLFGPAATVYAEVDRRRPGAHVDDDVFVAIEHAWGVRSHLWMSLTAASLGPRMRVLGDEAAYVKHGLDVQEDALAAGGRPGGPGWGAEPQEAWGVLDAGGRTTPVPTDAGAYERFYEGVRDAVRGEGRPPVDPADAVAALEVIDAARASSAEGRVVGLSG
jgi:scyllo-inositol 2-dehydrogenase (NADP+)